MKRLDVGDLGNVGVALEELVFFLATAVLGPAAIPVAGFMLHHGEFGVLGTLVPTLLGNSVRAVFLNRRHPAEPRRRVNPLLVIAETVVLVVAGFLVAHVVSLLPPALRLLAGVPSALGLIVWTAGSRDALRRSIDARPTWETRRTLALAGVLLTTALVSFWRVPERSTEEVAAEYLSARGVQIEPGTFHFVDPQRGGLRATFTRARAVVLGAEPGEPPEVYLVKVLLSHDGHVSRIAAAYNLSDTAAVGEAALAVSGKFAVWLIQDDGNTLGVEIADLRGAPPARGPGWSATARLQRAITDLQETGQARGVGRMSLKLTRPSRNASFELPEGRLVVRTDTSQLELELGRSELFGGAEEAELVMHERARPGDLITWAVDRVRALPFIGSEGMQWIKGVAQRAAEELENIEEQVVGIDADETIAEELGGILEQLPIASAGQIPGWPPAPLDPVLAPAMPGEGQWVSLAADSLVAPPSEETSPFLFTFIRTDRKRAYIQTSITLWDPRRIALHMVAGTREPKSTTGEVGTGVIPRDPEILSRVAAAFNGAFQAVHGEFGMVVRQRVLLPPKPYAATVAELRDGTTAFGTWPLDTKIPPHVVSLRQNMTPLIVEDQINPYGRHWWGGVPEGWTTETRTVRSGLCMTREGFGAYFYSASVDPEGLAAAMRLTRCTYGIHLDMNAGHTGFEFYRIAKKGELPTLDRPLDAMWEARGVVSGATDWEFSTRLMVRKMPLMDFPRYVHLTSRDFFYLTRRYLLPGARIPSLDPAHPTDGIWRVDLGPQVNPWPHAVAITRLHVPTEQGRPIAVTMTAIDPKQVTRAPEGEAGLVAFDLVAGEALTGLWLHDRRFFIAGDAPRGAVPV
jgi:hypothetical protein